MGVVETHGRSETAAMLDGLPVLPPKELDYKGNRLKEFDLDGAIARLPQLVLVDELAHTNVPGSRHPKRWQDVEELLCREIDVFTTLNVQHLESLNDVVGGITGIRVWETLPDTFFDRADEVMLVDIPADELLGRLKAGKVYVPEQADRASRAFPQATSSPCASSRCAAPPTRRGGRQSYRTASHRTRLEDRGLVPVLHRARPGGHGAHAATGDAAQRRLDRRYVETPALQRLPSGRRERI